MKEMMKKYTGIALGTVLGILTLSSCDKDDDHVGANPPDEVKQVFEAQYPNMNLSGILSGVIMRLSFFIQELMQNGICR